MNKIITFRVLSSGKVFIGFVLAITLSILKKKLITSFWYIIIFTIVFVIAGIFAIFLGFSPKFGAVIHTIPTAILTGASIVVFGLITIAGAKIWIENKVDFSQNKNLMVAAVTIILGTGDFALQFGDFNLGGIGTATFAALILNWFFSLKDKS